MRSGTGPGTGTATSKRARRVAAEIGGEAEVCDVSDRAGVEATAARILARHPAVHLLVNNAGVPARGTFLAIDPELVRRAIEVNYFGSVWCTRAFMPGLEGAAQRDGRARIVNLVSVAGPLRSPPRAGTPPPGMPSSRSLAR